MRLAGPAKDDANRPPIVAAAAAAAAVPAPTTTEAVDHSTIIVRRTRTRRRPRREQQQRSDTASPPARDATTVTASSHRKSRPRRLLVLYSLLWLLLQSLFVVASASSQPLKQQSRRTVARHPYNEYAWELNQINPWLSACDLSGPAPDLQGSCGPPEVPKSCPGSCQQAASFDRVVELLEAIENATKTMISTGAARKSRHHDDDDEDEDEDDDAANVEDEEAEGASAANGASREHRSKSSKKSGPSAASSAANDGGASGAGSAAAPDQCLFYLEESHKRDVCRQDFGGSASRSYAKTRENRYWYLKGLRLRHCCEQSAVHALAPGKLGPLEAVLEGGPGCSEALDKLLAVDQMAARLHCEFEEVLARYDCGQVYSVQHNCNHCKEAYRKWVCSSLVPYFAHGGPYPSEPSEESWTGRRLRPCRSLCQSVEQRCPYLLPGDRAPAYPTQYAGEPTFLCRDPNIPEVGEQAARALHPITEDECCFNICSEDKPGLGICANCTNRVVYMGPTHRDPATAPKCDMSSLPAPPPRPLSGLCGSGGIGSMMPSSTDSTDSPTTVMPSDSSPSSISSSSSSESPVVSATTSSSSELSSSPSSSSSSDMPYYSSSSSSTTSVATYSSSSAASSSTIRASQQLPLLCLFCLWGVLFSRQCSAVGQGLAALVLGLARRALARTSRTSRAIFTAILVALLPAAWIDRAYRNNNHNNGSSSSSSRRVVGPASLWGQSRGRRWRQSCLSCSSVGSSYRCRHCCYRWWLWPTRWKSSSSSRGCCCCCCNSRWLWLWPCRWKRPPASSSRNEPPRQRYNNRHHYQQQPWRVRKKRRRRKIHRASCSREPQPPPPPPTSRFLASSYVEQPS